MDEFQRGRVFPECGIYWRVLEPIVAQKFHVAQAVEPGAYFWCACGKSKSQPFCDGANKSSGFTPLKTEMTNNKAPALFRMLCGTGTRK